jgi:hypothetical protein
MASLYPTGDRLRSDISFSSHFPLLRPRFLCSAFAPIFYCRDFLQATLVEKLPSSKLPLDYWHSSPGQTMLPLAPQICENSHYRITQHLFFVKARGWQSWKRVLKT